MRTRCGADFHHQGVLAERAQDRGREYTRPDEHPLGDANSFTAVAEPVEYDEVGGVARLLAQELKSHLQVRTDPSRKRGG